MPPVFDWWFLTGLDYFTSLFANKRIRGGTIIRVYNTFRQIDAHYQVTEEGRLVSIVEQDSQPREPEQVLSLEQAPDGWWVNRSFIV